MLLPVATELLIDTFSPILKKRRTERVDAARKNVTHESFWHDPNFAHPCTDQPDPILIAALTLRPDPTVIRSNAEQVDPSLENDLNERLDPTLMASFNENLPAILVRALIEKACPQRANILTLMADPTWLCPDNESFSSAAKLLMLKELVNSDAVKTEITKHEPTRCSPRIDSPDPSLLTPRTEIQLELIV
jgi:hypothetical protein